MPFCQQCGFKYDDNARFCGGCGQAVGVKTTAGGFQAELPAGMLLCEGRYRILQKLGQSGFGITYLAEDVLLKTNRVIKEYYPEGAVRGASLTVSPPPSLAGEHQKLTEKFSEEAQSIAAFTHPGIIKVMDFFYANNTAYYVTEYIGGQSLRQLLDKRETPFTPKEVDGWLEQIAASLKVIHEKNMLHQDIKPDNIIISDSGQAVLIDFGAARAYTADKTKNYSVVYTPGYAPPEQQTAYAKRGLYTDIYALGAMLYELLTGHLPADAVLRHIQPSAFIRPRQVNLHLQKSVDEALVWALEILPEKRPQAIVAFMEKWRDADKRISGTYLRTYRADNAVCTILVGEYFIGCVEAEYDRHVAVAPNAKRLAYTINKKNGQAVVIDGKCSDMYSHIKEKIFSSDSLRFGYIVSEGGKEFVVVNGLREQEYDSVEQLVFSPDSRHVAYVAGRGEFFFIVVDGVEWPLRSDRISGLIFSPNSQQVVYCAKKDDIWRLIWNGEVCKIKSHQGWLPINKPIDKDTLDFLILISNLCQDYTVVVSPDNCRFGYIGIGNRRIDVGDSVTISDDEEFSLVGILEKHSLAVDERLCVSGLAFSPNSQKLAITGCAEKGFIIIDGTLHEVEYNPRCPSFFANNVGCIAGSFGSESLVVNGLVFGLADEIYWFRFSNDGGIEYACRVGRDILFRSARAPIPTYWVSDTEY